jgi:hypothetical protein
MPAVYLPKKFVERCQRYLEEHPEAADDVSEFIARCGRLGLWYLDKLLTEEEKRDCPEDPGDRHDDPPTMEGDEAHERKGVEKVAIRLPDRDYEKVRRLVVEKLGITTTVIAWYILCTFMVLHGYWELPPRI